MRLLVILAFVGFISGVGCAATSRSETQTHAVVAKNKIDEPEAIVGYGIGPVRAIEIATKHLREQYKLDTRQWQVSAALLFLPDTRWILFEHVPSKIGEEVMIRLNVWGEIRDVIFRRHPNKAENVAVIVDAVHALEFAKKYVLDSEYMPRGWIVSLWRSDITGRWKYGDKSIIWDRDPAKGRDWQIGFSPTPCTLGGFHCTVSADTGEIIRYWSFHGMMLEMSLEPIHGQRNRTGR